MNQVKGEVIKHPAAQLVPIRSADDIILARQAARTLAARLRFSSLELTEISAAISEIARNIVQHAGRGEIVLILEDVDGRSGIIIHSRDQGPGIDDIEQAMKKGVGLSGASRLMSDLSIFSEAGKGTLIRMTKWERLSS